LGLLSCPDAGSEKGDFSKEQIEKVGNLNSGLILRNFNDKTLKRILREILYGMAHLQENRMVHGDLRPSLIGVPLKREDNFRLLDRLGNSSKPIQAQTLNLKQGKNLYLSPELFKHILTSTDENFKYNPFKADIFSLGLIILEAGLFTSVEGIYDRETGEIHKEKLIKLVEDFIIKYPEDYILQETLMIMLEFSPKLRQEPLTLLKSLRKMERIAKEKGEFMVSQINYHKDALVNQVEFTESGYKLKDSGKVQYSFYHRFEGNFSTDAVKSDEVESEMRTSLVKRIKDRGSQIGVKGKNRGREMDKTFDRVTEDVEGEVSQNNSKKTSMRNGQNRQPNAEQGVLRNTLEQMILENVGIDLSTQQDIVRSKNQFSVNTINEMNPEKEEYLRTEYSKETESAYEKTNSEPLAVNINKRKTSKVDQIVQEQEELEKKMESLTREEQSNEPQVEEIELESQPEGQEAGSSKQVEELESDIRELVNPNNYKKPSFIKEVSGNFQIYENGEMMSSREDITELNSGPREISNTHKETAVSSSKNSSQYAREYDLYEGNVEDLLQGYTIKKRTDSQTEIVQLEQPEDDGFRGLSKKEIDEIIEDKITEIVEEEVKHQKLHKKTMELNTKVNKTSVGKEEQQDPSDEITSPNPTENNIFKSPEENPNYPSKVDDFEHDEQVVFQAEQNHFNQESMGGKCYS
jgi:serine/threonine protein kinase